MERSGNVYKPVMVVAHGKLEKTCWLSRTKVACPLCGVGRMRTKNDPDGNVSKEDQCDYCGQKFEYSDVRQLRMDSRL